MSATGMPAAVVSFFVFSSLYPLLSDSADYLKSSVSRVNNNMLFPALHNPLLFLSKTMVISHSKSLSVLGTAVYHSFIETASFLPRFFTAEVKLPSSQYNAPFWQWSWPSLSGIVYSLKRQV